MSRLVFQDSEKFPTTAAVAHDRSTLLSAVSWSPSLSSQPPAVTNLFLDWGNSEKWMWSGGKRGFNIGEEEIKDLAIIAWLSQEIPGVYGWCAGLREAGWWQRAESGWETAKTRLHFLKKLKWLHALLTFTGKETSLQKTATNWRSFDLNLHSVCVLNVKRGWDLSISAPKDWFLYGENTGFVIL